MLTRLKFLTAGESHGPGLTGIIEGLPAGIPLRVADLRAELKRRQQGVGRGKRMQIEDEQVEIHSGVRYGKTLGSPVSLWLPNRDWKNWQKQMKIEASDDPATPVTLPRPGHADLAGALKYDTDDIRNILERASARETAMRVALGATAKRFLEELGIRITSQVVQIGKVAARLNPVTPETDLAELERQVDVSL
ncbi:MAG: chorismate synthase, partial [Lentisphaeria bacterium]|nr:chorismate synthase [Lentisphaeria bacterium]